MRKLENTLVSDLAPSPNGASPMLTKRSKTLTHPKIPQKAENLSKMVRDALFGTFSSQY